MSHQRGDARKRLDESIARLEGVDQAQQPYDTSGDKWDELRREHQPTVLTGYAWCPACKQDSPCETARLLADIARKDEERAAALREWGEWQAEARRLDAALVEANERASDATEIAEDNLARAEQAERERDLLAQAMWDARAWLGFDTDGDKKFHSTNWELIASNHVREAEQARRDHDEALAEGEQAERQVRAVQALCDEWDSTVYNLPPGYPMTVNEFCRHWFKAPLRAAMSGVSGPTTCRVDGCDSEALPNGACSFHQVSEIDFGPTTEGASE